MPELPDVTLYVESIQRHLVGQTLEGLRLGNPFLVRSVDPPVSALVGRSLRSSERLGKRIVFEFEGGFFAVVHLMIAGRLRWRERGAKLPKRRGQAAFDFTHGTLLLTEEGTKRRASLTVVAGREALASFDRGGVEVLDADFHTFRTALLRENRTLKRALTDPRIVSGIGNAYSDEILHRARLSPFKQTQKLGEAEFERLFQACRETLTEWVERLRKEVGSDFPEKVTAFHPEFAVHGRYREPCPTCGTKVQRIRYADNEANYCVTCQTDGRLLADRALSRLLGKDWPRTLEELEARSDS